jgi:hypothetical protein
VIGMNKWSFAHLFGRRAAEDGDEKKDAEGEDGDEKKDAECEDGDEKKNAEGEDGEDGDEKKDDEQASMTPAERRAFSRGRKAERERLGRILGDKAASGRLETALHLACNTSVSAAEAVGILSASPKTATVNGTSPLDRRMGVGRRPDLGQGQDADSASTAAAGLASAFDREIAALSKPAKKD